MWKPVSIDQYVRIHLRNNPNDNEKTLRMRIDAALDYYKNGIKCRCGKDIWIVGSATAPFGRETIKMQPLCLTCIKNNSDDWEDDVLCKLNRNAQADEKEFKCGAYEKL